MADTSTQMPGVHEGEWLDGKPPAVRSKEPRHPGGRQRSPAVNPGMRPQRRPRTRCLDFPPAPIGARRPPRATGRPGPAHPLLRLKSKPHANCNGFVFRYINLQLVFSLLNNQLENVLECVSPVTYTKPCGPHDVTLLRDLEAIPRANLSKPRIRVLVSIFHFQNI